MGHDNRGQPRPPLGPPRGFTPDRPRRRRASRGSLRRRVRRADGMGTHWVSQSRASFREEAVTEPVAGWKIARSSVSHPEVHGSIAVPAGSSFWRKMLAFAGPGYLVAVGYMDPGNWATDLAGGARYGYTLLSVIMISNFMAILLQALSARLGIASGRDLAQACRDSYSWPVTIG